MENKARRIKKCNTSMQFTTFNIPPSGDVLVLGKECPIGALAAKKMLDTVAPAQIELIQFDDDVIDGILVKKQLFLRVEKEALLDALVQEVKEIMGLSCMICVKCDITVTVSREI